MKLKKLLSSQKILVRFIVSYHLTLILPLLIFGMICYNLFMDSMTKQMLNKYQISMSNGVNLLNKEIKNYQSIETQLHTYNLFNSEKIKASSYSYNEIRDVLNTLCASNSSIKDLQYYNLYAPDYLYTTLGTYSGEYIGEILFSNKKIDVSSALSEITMGTWFNYEQTEQIAPIFKNTVQYILPVNQIKGGYIIFRVSTDIFSSFFDNTVAETYILGKENEIIYVNDNENIEIDKLNKNYNEIMGVKYLTNDLVLIGTSIDQSIYPLKTIQIISTDEFFKEPRAVIKNVVYLLIGILVLGAILVYLLIYFSYRPIDKLNKSLRKEFDLPKDFNLSEVALTEYVLSEVKKRNKRLIEKNRFEKFFIGAINNSFEKKESYLSAASFLNIDTSMPYWYCVILKNEDALSISSINKFLRISLKSYTIEYPNSETMIIILATTKSEISYISNVFVSMSETICPKSRFFIGSREKNICDISNSYTVACNLYSDNSENNYANNVIVYDEFQKKIAVLYPKLELMSLQKAVTDLDCEKIDFFTNLILEKSLALKDNLKMFGKLVQSTVDILCTNQKDMVCIDYQKNISVEQNIENLAKVSKELIAVISSQKLNGKNYIVKEYIDKNYDSVELFAFSVAEHFNISVSNLSHQFKLQTGINISDYITNVKLEYAKELLIDNKLSIEEIARKTGYHHSSSFIRKFKDSVGVTPKKFRENNKI